MAAYDPATLAVACPFCGRPPHERCVSPGATIRIVPPHRARVRAGQQMAPAKG